MNTRSRVPASPSFASAGALMDRVPVCACASTAANPRNSGRQSRAGSRPRRGLRAAAREPAAARAGEGSKLSGEEAGRGVAERPLGEREGSGREANRPRWRRHEDAGRAARLGSARLGSARLGSARLGSAGLYHRRRARMSSEIRRLRQPHRARRARFDQLSCACWIHPFPTFGGLRPKKDRRQNTTHCAPATKAEARPAPTQRSPRMHSRMAHALGHPARSRLVSPAATAGLPAIELPCLHGPSARTPHPATKNGRKVLRARRAMGHGSRV